jgi:DNA replication protein DnaC
MNSNHDQTATHAREISRTFQALIDKAPDEEGQHGETSAHSTDYRAISSATGMPKRYRPDWPRPCDATWTENFRKVMAAVRSGAIIALIGNRGTGKTRLAAEAARNFAPAHSSYTTAMGLFLRIRATFGKKKGGESEDSIVNELSKSPLLVLDEVQERGNTPWEDRLLTHILDRRYGAMLPTVVIANLTESALIECLGDSIVSRLEEGGGILEITGPSHRSQNEEQQTLL